MMLPSVRQACDRASVRHGIKRPLGMWPSIRQAYDRASARHVTERQAVHARSKHINSSFNIIDHRKWTALYIIITDTNFISRGVFVLNFEFQLEIVSWIPEYWINLPWFVKWISELLQFYYLQRTLVHYWLRRSLSLESELLSVMIRSQSMVMKSIWIVLLARSH